MRKLAIVSLLVLFVCAFAYAQSPASNKAFFVAGTNDVTIAPVTGSPTITLLNAPNAVKTSSNGALEIAVSAECALWTYNTVTVSSASGKQTSSARAFVKVWAEVDGVKATPEEVTYCDRYQAVGAQLLITCAVPGVPGCTITDSLTLELFQRTKNANSFHFFIGPLAPVIHSVVVKAEGGIECTKNGVPDACPAGTEKEFADAKTAAVIGKRTVAIQEHNNWGTN